MGDISEEDIDGDQIAVFPADEVSGVDAVDADAGSGVLEDEVVVLGTSRSPALESGVGDEFRLGEVCAFDVGLDGLDDAVAALVEGDAEKADGGDRNLRGELRHAPEVLKW